MDLQSEYNKLKGKLKMLEEENISLSQNLEDLLLINILNNHPDKLPKSTVRPCLSELSSKE